MTRDDLTDSAYERLADLAEEGWDPGAFRLRRRGRPSLGDSGPSPRVATRVSPAVRARACARAAAEGKTLSEALRELIGSYADGKAETPRKG